MALKVYKPMTAGTRGRVDLRRDELTTDRPEKTLVSGKMSHAGRGAGGRISVRHQGGGHKRRYREIDFKRNKYGIPGTVKSIEYDPNRSANIMQTVINVISSLQKDCRLDKKLCLAKMQLQLLEMHFL